MSATGCVGGEPRDVGPPVQVDAMLQAAEPERLPRCVERDDLAVEHDRASRRRAPTPSSPATISGN